MALQFTPIDDAFAPLSNNRRRKREGKSLREGRDERDHEDHSDNETPVIVTPPKFIHAPPQADVIHPTLADDIIKMQPYLCLIFMIVVAGMLYDIRNAIIDARNILHDISIKRVDL